MLGFFMVLSDEQKAFLESSSERNRRDIWVVSAEFKEKYGFLLSESPLRKYCLGGGNQGNQRKPRHPYREETAKEIREAHPIYNGNAYLASKKERFSELTYRNNWRKMGLPVDMEAANKMRKEDRIEASRNDLSIVPETVSDTSGRVFI